MLKELFVKDLPTSGKIMSFFLVGDVSTRETKGGKPYLCVSLKDKTGELEGRLWDIIGDVSASFTAGKYVKINGEMSEWLGAKQIAIKQFRPVTEEEMSDLNVTDFRIRADRPSEEMWHDMIMLFHEHTKRGAIYDIVDSLLAKNKDKFLIAPAAKRVHHNYEGGLLEHTLSLLTIAVKVADHYKLNKELLVAACILHDMAKTRELTYGDTIGYSTEGSLVGHVSLMMLEISEECDCQGVSDKVRTELLHVVASHHGQRDWGAPVVPLMREAIAFHFLDMIDSRLAIFDRMLKTDTTVGDFTAFVNEIGGPLYKPTPGEVDDKTELGS